ncbi:MAG TPA: hypothetical protein VFK47_07040 [Ktedonobacteraceae bacterium]|nr:hypothetical protein [Ktedonobacteraceae bacterium]
MPHLNRPSTTVFRLEGDFPGGTFILNKHYFPVLRRMLNEVPLVVGATLTINKPSELRIHHYGLTSGETRQFLSGVERVLRAAVQDGLLSDYIPPSQHLSLKVRVVKTVPDSKGFDPGFLEMMEKIKHGRW